MKKKLLAAAVAGSLALPGAAMAASSVVITGFLKASITYTDISNYNANGTRSGATTTGKDSEWRLNDESSRVIFQITEDMGGGLQAIGQVDWRVTLDTGTDATNGNTWVGLRSKSWGTMTYGRHDLHYGQYKEGLEGSAITLKAAAIALFDYTSTTTVNAAGTPTSATWAAFANTTRTPNSFVWQSPKWGMFDLLIAYSFEPLAAAESELGSTGKAGYGWNFKPRISGKNWDILYSYWDAKADNSTTGWQRGHKITGSYDWGKFGMAAGWHDRELKGTAGKTHESDAYMIGGRYRTGPHLFGAHWTHAGDDKVSRGDSSADMFALGYQYSLSKRTGVGMAYLMINNDSGGAYNFFTTTGGLGNPAAAITAGEDPRIFSFTIRHAF